MKRTILINQQAVIEAGLELDFIDLVIFDYIKDFSHSEKVMKVQCLDGVYFWVAHTKIMEDLPLLGIKTKAGIVKRIDRLVEAGILIKAKESVSVGKSLYRFGPNYDILVGTPLNENSTPYKKIDGGDKQNYIAPLNENIGNNPETNNCIKDISFADAKGDNTRDARPQKNTRYKFFENSEIAKWEDFERVFGTDEYAGADIRHYYDTIKDWATARGAKYIDWIAFVRNWMRRDYKDGKLVRNQQTTGLPGNLQPWEYEMIMRDRANDAPELWPGL